MQGAQVANQVDKEVEVPTATRDEDKVTYWVNKGFIALVGIASTLLLSFGSWIIVSLNEINQSTSIMATEFSATKRDITELKTSVDSLRLRGESWATKDSLSMTKDAILDQITKLRDQVNVLELRVQRMEASEKR